MSFIKNYIILFAWMLFVSFLGKSMFAFYLYDFLDIWQKFYAIFWGYKFDFALSAVFALLFTFLDFHKKSMLILSSVLSISVFVFLIADTMYFQDASRHISYELKDALTDINGLFGTILNDHLKLVLTCFVLILLLCFTFIGFISKSLSEIKFSKMYVVKKIILISLSVFFLRGMSQNVPLNPWQSNQIGNAVLASIALNGAYNALYTNIKNKGDIKITKDYKVEDENISIKALYAKDTAYDKVLLKSPNVVIFFLESWSGILLRAYGGKHNITPNFDEILSKSIRPKAMIANGHRTTEGIFATLCSFQNPLGKSIAKTKLQYYKYKTFLHLLDELSYESAFFQGTNKETSGTGSLAQSMGFKSSYGKKDVKKRKYEENYWGVHDEDLYGFVFKKLQNMKPPFVIGINGASTHDKVLPNGVKKSMFTKNKNLNDILNTLHYADFAMGEFIKKIEKIYPNTIFVLLADHCGGNIRGNFLNYLIPFAIYSNRLKPKFIDAFVSQRDIAPTLTDIILGDYKKIAPSFSGKSLLRNENFFADYYSNGILGLVKGSIAYEFEEERVRCFDVSKFYPKSVKCPEDKHEVGDQIKSFTNISQRLLFEGKVSEFYKYLP